VLCSSLFNVGIPARLVAEYVHREQNRRLYNANGMYHGRTQTNQTYVKIRCQANSRQKTVSKSEVFPLAHCSQKGHRLDLFTVHLTHLVGILTGSEHIPVLLTSP